MSLKLHLLESDKELKKKLPAIKKTATDAITRIGKALSFKEDVDVVLYRYTAPERDLTFSGYTPNKNLVFIYADPAQRGFNSLIEKQLPKALAHELHHACRSQHPGFGESFGEILVSEGLAAHFEQDVFGGKPAAFYVNYSDDQLKRLWKRVSPLLKSNKFSYDDWFFGNKGKKIPKHAGYAIAYWLVGKIPGPLPSIKFASEAAGQIIKNVI